MTSGRLSIELPGGQTLAYGAAVSGETLPLGIPDSAQIRVRRERFFRRCVLSGDIGFAESYLDGDWETNDLTAVVAWFVHNLEAAPTLSGSRRSGGEAAFNVLRFVHRVGHWLRFNNRLNARRNISAHYDLSNDFFALFLDPSLMYSSAKWSRPEQTLEEAQSEKNDALCRALQLKPTDHVLEIGTGWGGWSLHAARAYGCKVTTVTLSQEQHTLATQRVAAAGLSDRIEVKLQDYRDLTGHYEKIVSIEMMEALGHRYLPIFCETLSRLLKKDGLLALQFITCPDSRYNAFRRGVDFIQKYIFPGSLLLPLNRVNALLSRSGEFVLHQCTDLGHDYAKTLRLWRQRFEANLDGVHHLGFDERFVRKWRYYLCYCEAAFALRNISVVQTLFTRPNNLSL
jgi:cyclopropane-fatty-acyl-phospholipid synthase